MVNALIVLKFLRLSCSLFELKQTGELSCRRLGVVQDDFVGNFLDRLAVLCRDQAFANLDLLNDVGGAVLECTDEIGSAVITEQVTDVSPHVADERADDFVGIELCLVDARFDASLNVRTLKVAAGKDGGGAWRVARVDCG